MLTDSEVTEVRGHASQIAREEINHFINEIQDKLERDAQGRGGVHEDQTTIKRKTMWKLLEEGRRPT